MKKLVSMIVLGFVLHLQAQDRPKLVVGIVVDQMKMEYLYRFQNDFSENEETIYQGLEVGEIRSHV